MKQDPQGSTTPMQRMLATSAACIAIAAIFVALEGEYLWAAGMAVTAILMGIGAVFFPK